MGLSFAALTNAALGGGAAFNTGKREGQADARKERQTALALERQLRVDAMNEALHASQMAENEAQRKYYLEQANKIKYELEHPKPVAPVLGTPEYRNAQRDLATDRARASAQFRAPTEGEVDRASGFSAADARRARMADDFAARYVEMFKGNAPAAVAYIEKNPALKAEAVKLGVTEGHYNAATGRRSRVGPGTQKPAGADFDALLGDESSGEAPVATAPSSAPQPSRAVPSVPTAKALEASIPTLNPVVVRATPTSSNAGTKGPKPPVPTSTPRANPLRANSPKAGTPTDVPKGADPEKYRTDKRYKMWVDSITKSK